MSRDTQPRTTTGPAAREAERTVSPLVDVYENDREVLLIADLPGVAKESLHLRVDADDLLIEGRPNDVVEGALLREEYRARAFRRSFTLPRGIDRDKIEAELVAGVLRLHLPKQREQEPRKIPIRTG